MSKGNLSLLNHIRERLQLARRQTARNGPPQYVIHLIPGTPVLPIKKSEEPLFISVLSAVVVNI